MAIFNPQVPDTQDPNYLGYSHPSGSDFKQISVQGQMLKDAGGLIEGAVKGTDEVVKLLASDEVHNRVDAERDAYTAALDAGNAAVRLGGLTGVAGKTTVNQQAADQQPLDLAPSEASMPPGLKNLPNQLSAMSGARANGRISETDYYGRLAALTKDIRSRYPEGYRDWIDSQVQKITGVDPANAYIKSILGDINSFMTTGQKEREHILGMARKGVEEGFSNADKWYGALSAGNADPNEFMGWYLSQSKYKNDHARIKAAMDINNTTREGIIQDYTDAFNTKAVGDISGFLDTLSSKAATLGTTKDQYGNMVIDPTKAEQYGQMILDQKEAARIALRKYLVTPDEKGMRPADIMKPDEVNKLIDGHLSIFDSLAKRATDGQTGMTGTYARLFKGIQDRNDLNLFRDKNMGWLAQQMDLLNRRMGPEDATKLMKNWLEDTKMTPAMNTYYSTQELERRFPKDPLNPPSLNQQIEKAKSDGIAAPKYFDKLLDVIHAPHGLLDPKSTPEEKTNIALMLSNPDNFGLFRKIAPDYTDSQGRQRPGLYAVYQNFTSPDVVKAMKGQGDQIFKNYQNFIETSFGKDLFPKEVMNLNTLSSQPNMHIAWDQEQHKFDLVITDNGKVIDTQAQTSTNLYYSKHGNAPSLTIRTPLIPEGSLKEARQSIYNLNRGLQGVSNIAKVAGTDVDAYLLQTLGDLGVDLSRISNPEALPDKILSAIVAARPRVDIKKKGKPD